MEIFVHTDRCANEMFGKDNVNAIVLSPSYRKGKGIVLHLGKTHRANGMWATMIDFNPRTNSTILLRPMARGNAKILAQYENAVLKAQEDIANAFIDFDLNKAYNLVESNL